MKKYLVVGGSGFIGSCFLNKHNTNNNLYNLDKSQSPFYPEITTIHDIRIKEDLASKLSGFDGVILLAAEHKDDIYPTKLYYDVNVEGTKNILDAMDKNSIKELIFTSSVAVYGINKGICDESSKMDPFNHYGKSKKMAEKVIYDWYIKDKKQKTVTIIRPTVVFGERNRGNVYNLIKLISKKYFIMVGKGKNIKSICYVNNLAMFIKNRLDISEMGYNIYNYVDKPDLSVSEIVEIVQNSLGINKSKIYIPYYIGILGGYFFDIISFIFRKKIAISSVRIKKFCAVTQFDATKLHSVFKPPHPITDSLIKTIEFEFIEKKSDNIHFFSE